MAITVSQSKIKTWRRCRRAYHYKYIEKLEPRRKARPLVFGSIVHEMIEANAGSIDWMTVGEKYRKEVKKLFSAERDDYLQIIEDAEMLMEEYFEYYKNDKMKFVAIKGKMAEHEFEVQIAKGVNLKGKIDAVMQSKDKRIWLTEHKSHKEIPGEDVRFRDLQTIMYDRVLPELGIKKVDGVLWDYIRSKAPPVPELLKDGSLSKRKIDTFAAVYEATVLRHKLKVKDYQDIIDSLEGNEKNFFKRVYMPINRAMSKELVDEFVQTAREVEEKAGKDKTRNLTRDCSWCSYELLCKTELTGGDAESVRKREYKVEEPKDVEEETE